MLDCEASPPIVRACPIAKSVTKPSNRLRTVALKLIARSNVECGPIGVEQPRSVTLRQPNDLRSQRTPWRLNALRVKSIDYPSAFRPCSMPRIQWPWLSIKSLRRGKPFGTSLGMLTETEANGTKVSLLRKPWVRSFWRVLPLALSQSRALNLPTKRNVMLPLLCRNRLRRFKIQFLKAHAIKIRVSFAVCDHMLFFRSHLLAVIGRR